MKDFFTELRRRNVVRVGIAYAVTSWLVIQIADVAADNLGFPEWFMPMIFVVLGLGFPIVLFFSWAFEITPEGVMKTKDVDKSQSITHGTGQKINKLIAGALVMALGFIAYNQFFAGPQSGVQQAEASQTSIAVLPFVNMSSDPEQEYFSDGISEELLNLLAKIPELQVAGRTSSFAFKGKNQDLREIGDTLGVSFLLEGSVRKQGNQVRITAQLIRASDGIHMWSETYDRPLDDVFAIQDEISGAITSELQVRILGDDRAPVHAQQVGAEAHNLYLLGLQRFNRGEFDTLIEARDYFRRAYEAEPGYLDAIWAYGLSIGGLEDYGVIDRTEAEREINRTVNLLRAEGVEDAPLTLMLRGRLENFRDNREAWEALIQQAYTADPNNPLVMEELAIVYRDTGRWQEGITLLKQALERDPLSLLLSHSLAASYAFAGQFQEAIPVLNRMIEIDPEYAQSYSTLGNIQRVLGMPGEAMRNEIIAYRKDASDPDAPSGIADSLLRYGLVDEAKPYIDQAEAMSPNEVYNISLLADFNLQKGNEAEAVDIAEALVLSGRPSRHRSTQRSILIAAKGLLATGQGERLKRLLEAHIPEYATDPTDFTSEIDGGNNIQHRLAHAHLLARAYKSMGQEDVSRQIIEAAMASNEENINNQGFIRRQDVNLAMFFLGLGELEQARDIWINPENRSSLEIIFLDNESTWLFDPLLVFPEFKALADELKADHAAARAEVVAVLDEMATD